MKKIVYISILLLICACSKPTSKSPNCKVVSIASLRDKATSFRSELIRDNIAVEGQITANDKYGEFYNTIILDDGTAAVKLLCELDNSYQNYTFGSCVRLYCNGLYLISEYGALRIGAEPTDEYTLDNISSKRLGQYLKSAPLTKPIEPLKLPIDQLTPLHNNSYVELSRVKITDSLGIDTFCARDTLTGHAVNTLHQITDASGREIELFVNRRCRYANAPLPQRECTLQVIINYFDGRYSATITSCGYLEE